MKLGVLMTPVIVRPVPTVEGEGGGGGSAVIDPIGALMVVLTS